MANLSHSCCAMSSSLSHAPTSRHPAIRWTCSACASAILPHPTMPTLSTEVLFPAAAEVGLECLLGRHRCLQPSLSFNLPLL